MLIVGFKRLILVCSSGYGYDDIGRDTLKNCLPKHLAVRMRSFALKLCLGPMRWRLRCKGLLSPDKRYAMCLVSLYDTLEQVIGIEDTLGSLMRLGVHYKQIELLPDGSIDYEAIKKALKEDDSIAVVAVQRSAGYAWRRSLHIHEIALLADLVHAQNPHTMVFCR